MHSYDIDALYSAIVDDLLAARARANATGGVNNIRAKGDGPEKAVREWIASVVGSQYRVTEGHVVRADGRKSKQLDVIVVRDVPTATMYGSRGGETELVRAECVAAVGEVKSSWYCRDGVVKSYAQMAEEIGLLQEGLLVENSARFGRLKGDSRLSHMAAPTTGREWLNCCYTFLLVLGMGKCDLKELARDMEEVGVPPKEASVLILDSDLGGAICVPHRIKNGEAVLGVPAEVYRDTDEAGLPSSWVTVQDTHPEPSVAAGRLLHWFLADLQLHLSTSSWEFADPRRYVKLSQPLRRRHTGEGVSSG